MTADAGAGGDGVSPATCSSCSHSRTGSTRALCETVVGAAGDAAGTRWTSGSSGRSQAGPDDVVWSDAILLVTRPIWVHVRCAQGLLRADLSPCLDTTVGLPYGLLVKGDTDVDGAVASVERITTGLRWRRVLPPVTVVGAIGPGDIERATELGAALAAGMAAGCSELPEMSSRIRSRRS